MRQVVFKYVFAGPLMKLHLPMGAEVLSVGWQDEGVVLWAKVDPDTEDGESRLFVFYDTGLTMASSAHKFIGTVQQPNGLVRHVFEVLPDRYVITNG